MIRTFAALAVAAALMHHADTARAAGRAEAGTRDGIGRLFLDPAQRGRRSDVATPDQQAPSATAPDTQTNATPSMFHLNGIALGERGRMTLWANGARFQPDPTMSIVALDAPGRVRLTMADGRTSIELRVGQRLELGSLLVTETFEGRPAVDIAEPPADSLPSPKATHTAVRRPPTRAPAIHLHVHTAKPGSRRKAAKREDD